MRRYLVSNATFERNPLGDWILCASGFVQASRAGLDVPNWRDVGGWTARVCLA